MQTPPLVTDPCSTVDLCLPQAGPTPTRITTCHDPTSHASTSDSAGQPVLVSPLVAPNSQDDRSCGIPGHRNRCAVLDSDAKRHPTVGEHLRRLPTASADIRSHMRDFVTEEVCGRLPRPPEEATIDGNGDALSSATMAKAVAVPDFHHFVAVGSSALLAAPATEAAAAPAAESATPLTATPVAAAPVDVSSHLPEEVVATPAVSPPFDVPPSDDGSTSDAPTQTPEEVMADAASPPNGSPPSDDGSTSDAPASDSDDQLVLAPPPVAPNSGLFFYWLRANTGQPPPWPASTSPPPGGLTGGGGWGGGGGVV